MNVVVTMYHTIIVSVAGSHPTWGQDDFVPLNKAFK